MPPQPTRRARAGAAAPCAVVHVTVVLASAALCCCFLALLGSPASAAAIRARSGHQARAPVVPPGVVASAASAARWNVLLDEYNASNFLDGAASSGSSAHNRAAAGRPRTAADRWKWYTKDDPVGGYSNYVNRSTAEAEGLVTLRPDAVVLRVDSEGRPAEGARGRDTIRLDSLATYNAPALFLYDIARMPSGCGSWPAVLTFGPDYPEHGEVDVVEGVNLQTTDVITLHTGVGRCVMPDEGATGRGEQRGRQRTTDCSSDAGLVGCSVAASQGGGGGNRTASFGADFNKARGGVFAQLWDADVGISIYFIPRAAIERAAAEGGEDDSRKSAGARRAPRPVLSPPDPSTWGLPEAFFPFSAQNCTSSHFGDHRIVVETGLCGSWAGTVYAKSGCPGTDCTAYVRDNPEAFRDVYWEIRSIQVWGREQT